MAEYKVSSEQLDSTASAIGGHAETMLSEIEAVLKKVESTQAFWSGQAQGTYDRLMRDWKSTADKVRESLDETVQALRYAAQRLRRHRTGSGQPLRPLISTLTDVRQTGSGGE